MISTHRTANRLPTPPAWMMMRAATEILFSRRVTLTEHYWVTFRERRRSTSLPSGWNGQIDAVGAANFLIGEGLFIGQPPQFTQLLLNMAKAADAAHTRMARLYAEMPRGAQQEEAPDEDMPF